MSSAKWRKRGSNPIRKRKKSSNAHQARLYILLEIQLNAAFVQFVRARRVERHVRLRLTRLNEIVVDKKFLILFAADIGKHFPVDFDAGRKWLTAFRFHLPTKCGVLDDVLFGVGQIVFGEHSANSSSPATICFQVSGDLGRIHLANDNTAPKNFSVGYGRATK